MNPKDIQINHRNLARKETQARRKSMVIKVLYFNIQKNKLSKEKKSYLNLLKLEAKYYYNPLNLLVYYMNNQKNHQLPLG